MADPLGEQYRRRRKELGLSRQEVAGRAGVSQTSIFNVEAGKTATTQLLGQVAEALGCRFEGRLLLNAPTSNAELVRVALDVPTDLTREAAELLRWLPHVPKSHLPALIELFRLYKTRS